MGLLILFGLALAIIVVVGELWLIRMIRRPPRRTLGAALARGYPTAPEDVQLEGEAVQFRLPDDHTTEGWVLTGGDPAGPIVVMSHGWASGRYGLLIKAPLLAPFASRVVVYDLRGHGDASAPMTTMGPREVDDLLAIVDQVRPTDEPERSAVLFGSSMGGVISMAGAARAGDKIEGVITEAPYRTLAHPLAGQLRRRHSPPWPFVPLTVAHMRFWVKGFAAFDPDGHASQLRCPLLILHGDADTISPHAHGQQIANSAVDAELVTFAGAGHSRLHEHDDVSYREALERFFKRVSQDRDHAGQSERK